MQKENELQEKIDALTEDNAHLSFQLGEALAAIRSQEDILRDQGVFQTRIWFKSVDGNNDYSTFVNEAPLGGFKYEVLDFEPKDKENYTPMFVHNFNVDEFLNIVERNNKYEKALKSLRELSQLKNDLLMEEIILNALEEDTSND